MKKAEIVKSVNGLFSKTSFQLKKHSPEMLRQFINAKKMNL